MADDPNQIVLSLIDLWCERREFQPLAHVLPAYVGNNGLTDGWAQVRDALKHAYAMCSDLPSGEREQIKNAYVAIDAALLNP